MLFIPRLKKNLLFIKQFIVVGSQIKTKAEGCVLTNAIGVLIAQCTIDIDLYKLGSSIQEHIIIPYVMPTATNLTNAKLWHHRMGCINERRMQCIDLYVHLMLRISTCIIGK